MFTLTPEMLAGRKIGLERETLRVTQSGGQLATTPHPLAFGAAITHPGITVDYAEQMLEFVTHAYHSTGEAYAELWQTTAWVQQHLAAQGEMLWPYSMPPLLPSAERIEPADFGSSGIGQFKHLYRVGLGYRYGREMQLIAGTHFNYSLPVSVIEQIAIARDYAPDCARTACNEVYLGAIRNVTRYGWLVSYLLGASPDVSESFIRAVQQANGLTVTDQREYDCATSLRMSDIGYTNKRRCRWQAELNYFDKFLDSIAVGLAETCTIFSDIGIVDEAGQPRQLNDKVLQIENEFYSIARPKAVSVDGETPLVALANHGIEYLELRMTDLDPTATIGMTPESLAFLEVFVLLCLTSPSPPLSIAELERCEHNRVKIANEGRGEVMLQSVDGDCAASDCAMALLDKCLTIARVLDVANTNATSPSPTISATLDEDVAVPAVSAVSVIETLQVQVRNQQRLSQRIHQEVEQRHHGDVNAYARAQADRHRQRLSETVLSVDYQQRQQTLAAESLQKAQALVDQGQNFEAYYESYRAQLQRLFAARQIPIVN